MADERSAEDLVVARILTMLPHLVWEAQHPRTCTHSLRWGARKRRSAGNDEPRPPPPHSPSAATARRRSRPLSLHHPTAPPHSVEKLNDKKRSGGHKRPCRATVALEEKATAATAVASACAGWGSDPAAPGTSSPETPLDFCISGEEPDAEARPLPPDAERPRAKRLKSNHRELAKRVDLLMLTRTELQKEAAEARNRLQAERWTYSELVALRIKLEKEAPPHNLHQLQQQQHLLNGTSCFGLPPRCLVGPIPRAHDHVYHHNPHPQPYQHLWPRQWANGGYPVVSHQPTAEFCVRPPLALDHQTTAQAGKHSQPLALAGSQGGSRPCKIPDLNARADEDLAWSF